MDFTRSETEQQVIWIFGLRLQFEDSICWMKLAGLTASLICEDHSNNKSAPTSREVREPPASFEVKLSNDPNSYNNLVYSSNRK